jgi:Flp pilus assembly protein TadD
VIDRRHHFPLAGAAVALAVVGAYANHFGNAFHFDDSHTVEANLYIRDLRNVPRFFTDARTFSALPANQSWRPLVTTTLALDYALGRLAPLPYHLDNFLAFGGLLALLVLLYRRALDQAGAGPAARWAALLGAAWFGLHAAHAETVNYVISRSDILSTLGVVAAVVLHGLPRARRLQLHLIPLALGMLAKEQAAMGAPLLLLHEALVERGLSLRELLAPRRLGGLLWRTLPAFLLCFGLLALGRALAPGWSAGGTARLEYLQTQAFVLVHYLLTFLLPLSLSADTDWRLIASPLDDRVLVGLAVLATLAVAAWRASRTPAGRPIAFGILWWFLALLPTSSIVPLSEVLNDHRLFFADVGLVLAAVQALHLLVRPVFDRGDRRRQAAVAAGAVLVLAVHGYGVHRRNQVWRTEESLWRDVTMKSPENGRGWMNYGLARMSLGDYQLARQLFERALTLAPQYGYAHVNLAIALAALGQGAEAERHFQEGVRLQPDVPVLRAFYARWLLSQGRYRGATALLREALAGSAADPMAHRLLLQALADTEDWPALERAARETLAIQPGEPRARLCLEAAAEAIGRGPATSPAPPWTEGVAPTGPALVERSLVAYREGRFLGALLAVERALDLAPDQPEGFNLRCASLNGLGRFAEAVPACERALALRPDFPLASANLAAARQGLGR